MPRGPRHQSTGRKPGDLSAGLRPAALNIALRSPTSASGVVLLYPFADPINDCLARLSRRP
ncbi:MAG: hypothetical protein AABZ12_07120 [Planctomycetota bacterium]